MLLMLSFHHSYTDLVSHLKNRATIALARQCLQRVHFLCVKRHEIAVDSSHDINVKVFLSSYMISMFPTEVFEKTELDPIDRSLLEVAVQLSIRFERILRLVESKRDFKRVPSELTAGFVPMLLLFMARFSVWYNRDNRGGQQRVQRILDVLLTLDECLILVPQNQGDAAADPTESLRQRTEIKGQILKLRQMLEDLPGGVAALALYDETHKKKVEEGARMMSQSLSTLPSSEQYAHELFLNPFFQLETEHMGAITADARAARDRFQTVRSLLVILFSIIFCVHSY